MISEYCRTRLQSRPFTHIVMDLHREVVRSPQYAARKRAMLQPVHSLPVMPIPQQPKHQPKYVAYGANTVPMRQNPPGQQHQSQHQSRHRGRGSLFKEQSRNSRSQPNLLSMDDQRWKSNAKMNEMGYGCVPDLRNLHQRTNSQPECRFERGEEKFFIYWEEGKRVNGGVWEKCNFSEERWLFECLPALLLSSFGLLKSESTVFIFKD